MQRVVETITNKLVLWLVISSTIFTILVTLCQLYFDYMGHMPRATVAVGNAAPTRLAVPKQSIIPRAGNSATHSLKSLLYQDGLAYAAVNFDDEITGELGKIIARTHFTENVSLPFRSDKVHDSPVLGVVADIKPIYSGLEDRFFQYFYINGAKIFLSAGFVFLIYQWLVTRHLESLARQIQKQDSANPSIPISLGRKSNNRTDELDLLVSGIKRLQVAAHEATGSFAANEAQLSLFFEATEEAILGVDKDGRCSFVNKNCLKMLHLKESDSVVGHHVQKILSHEPARQDHVAQPQPTNENQNFGNKPSREHRFSAKESSWQAGAKCLIGTSIENGVTLQTDKGVLVGFSGGRHPVSFRSHPVHVNGKVTGAIVFIKDNSESRALKYEHELLSQAIEQLPVMVFIAAPDSTIQFVNHGVEHLTGYTRDQLLGRSLYTYADIAVEGKLNMHDVQQQLLAGRQWEGVVRIHSKNGVMLNLYCVVSPVFNETKEVINIISVCREISYELALQNELINSKKMEAVGRLSSSFAHEFGNPLFGVHSVLKDISDRTSLTQGDKTLLDLAKQECDKMRDMIREFQKQYRDSKINKINSTVTEVIYGVLDEFRPLIESEKIEKLVDIDEAIKSVMINKSRFSLIFRNITINAIEAMQGGGGRLKVTGLLDDDCIKLSVEDRGIGIREEYHELIFEPFFSTKPKIEGAGLGLSLAYGAVQSLGGNLTFSTQESEGTVFTIALPFSSASPDIT